MIFDNLIKPKWQHRDPQIRKLALENISDPMILNEVVQHDEAAEVRKAALLKITELEIIAQLAQRDPDLQVQELAEQRLKQLLCGQKENGPNLETRLTWLNQNANAELMAHIAVQGQEFELRLAAIAKIEREGLLGDIAINDPVSDVRFAAVEKLTQKSTLDRVFKAVRNRDKRVSRKAREKLDELLEALERPKRIRAECEAIYGRLKSLEQRLTADNSPLLQEVTALEGSNAWKQEHTEFNRLQERWQTIANEATTEFQNRFAELQQTINAIFERYHQTQAAAQQREQALLPLRAAKRTLCEQMEALLTELKHQQRLSDEEKISVEQRIQTLQREWDNTHKLDESSAERHWQIRFDKATQALQKLIHKLSEYHHLATKLESICTQADTLLHDQVALKPEQLKDLQERWQNTIIENHSVELLNELTARFAKAVNAIETRLQEQKEQREQVVQELKQLLKQMEIALEEGELKTAIPLEKQTRELFNKLESLSITRHKSLEKRLHSCTTKINQLRGWQRWGNKLEREKLCQEMEDLLEIEFDNAEDLILLTEEKQTAWKRLGPIGYSQQLRERFYKACHTAYQWYREHLCLKMTTLTEHDDFHPEEIARLIREAQTKWKQLGSQGHTQELWERFNQASQIAYAPCQAYFNKQAQEREQNFCEKQLLCERLEAFTQNTDWEQPNWKEVYHFAREIEKQWRNIGTTDRKVKKTVQRRFQAAMQIMQLHLDKERQRNCRYRLHLLGQVDQITYQLQEAIATQQSRIEAHEAEVKKMIEAKINEAIEQVKTIQEQWQVTVPENRRVEREFWKVFRSSCDVVFEYRKQQQETLKQELQTYLNSKIQLCEQIEALSRLEGEAIKTAPVQVKKLREQWKNVKTDWSKAGNNPSLLRKKIKVTDAIEDRFEKACQRVDKQHQAQLATERRTQLDRLKLKAAFCTELEQADSWARSQIQTEPEWLQQIQSAWAQLPTLADSHLETAIEQRFQEICTIITTGESVISEATLENKTTLCIRMEIIAGIESPPEAAQARMAYQVARLSKAMTGGDRKVIDKQTEAEEIERNWYLSGTVPSEQSLSLEQRFNRACQAFYSRRHN